MLLGAGVDAYSTTTEIPGRSKADPVLQRAVSHAVMRADVLELPACASGTSVHTELATSSATGGASLWVER